MNDQSKWHDDIRFDRLVDGELSPEEYRSLVAALDDEPSGWRRCALAFLEAQALGQELGSIRRTGQLKDAPPAGELALSTRGAGGSGWKLFLAMAASFLVAFALGVVVPGWFRAADSPGSLTSRVGVAANSGVYSGLQQQSPDPRPLGNARLVMDGPGDSHTDAAQVPIYEVSGSAAQWLGSQEPALPAELIAELERRGHKVERQQQYVPVDWEDGRQGVVPVEGYRITPVRYTY